MPWLHVLLGIGCPVVPDCGNPLAPSQAGDNAAAVRLGSLDELGRLQQRPPAGVTVPAARFAARPSPGSCRAPATPRRASDFDVPGNSIQTAVITGCGAHAGLLLVAIIVS